MPALAALRAAPSTLPCAVIVAALLALAADGGGIGLISFAPLGLALLALLALSAVVLADGLRDTPGPVIAVLGTLAALCAWSYLSILWAADRGAAWAGADRTLLYLVIAAQFGLWRQRPETAAALLAAWAAGMVAVAALVAVRILFADDPMVWFSADRLAQPAGYANAQAATWLLALWPCVALAAAPAMGVALRAGLAGGAVLLTGLAVLSLSRGALLAVPLVLVGLLALAPHRLRLLAVIAAVAAGIAASLPALLAVGPALRSGVGEAAAIEAALRWALASAAVVAGVVGAAILLARRAVAARWLGADTAGRVRRVWRVAAPAGLVVAVLVALGLAGDPGARVTAAWTSFSDGYAPRTAQASRLGDLSSNRPDFYRVALDTFAREPVRGVGVDNFQLEYLRDGASRETPRHPHSWPLSVLSGLGAVGALLALAWLAAIVWASRAALRRPGAPAAAVATGSLAAFAGFLLHGAGDWLWEYPPVALPAFALLGLALALVPGRAPRRRRAVRRATGALLGACILAAAALMAPWLAEREARTAGATWPSDPLDAYRRVERAARWNPLSAGPYLTGGTIAVRRGTLHVADRYFAAALVRQPDAPLALLQRGAIASAFGDTPRAVALLRRAVAADPRNEVAGAALRDAERGRPIDVGQLNAELLARGRAVASG